MDNGLIQSQDQEDNIVTTTPFQVEKSREDNWTASDRWYVSHSSMALYETDPEGWVRKYMGGLKEPQNAAMAVGTVFDAMVKAHLEVDYGGDGSCGKYLAGSLTIEDGEEKDRALDGGEVTFKEYLTSPNYAELRRFLDGKDGLGRWQVDLEGDRTGALDWLGPTGEGVDVRNVDGSRSVLIKAKPDLVMHRLVARPGPNGATILVCQGVILDWKVNGRYSKSGASVKNGWILKSKRGSPLLPGSAGPDGVGRWKQDARGEAESQIMFVGTKINATPMEKVERSWATQTAIYGWVWGWETVLDSNVTSLNTEDQAVTSLDPQSEGVHRCEWISWIEQAAWNGTKESQRAVTFGTHRYRLTEAWMQEVKQRVIDYWTAIKIDMRPLKTMNLPGGLPEEIDIMKQIISSTRSGVSEYVTGAENMDLSTVAQLIRAR